MSVAERTILFWASFLFFFSLVRVTGARTIGWLGFAGCASDQVGMVGCPDSGGERRKGKLGCVMRFFKALHFRPVYACRGGGGVKLLSRSRLRCDDVCMCMCILATFFSLSSVYFFFPLLSFFRYRFNSIFLYFLNFSLGGFGIFL